MVAQRGRGCGAGRRSDWHVVQVEVVVVVRCQHFDDALEGCLGKKETRRGNGELVS